MKRLLVFTEAYNRGGGNRSVVDFVNSISGDYEDVWITSNHGAFFPEDFERLTGESIFHPLAFVTRARILNRFRLLPSAFRTVFAVPLFLLEPLFLLVNVLLFCSLINRIKPSRILSCNGGYPAAMACIAMAFAARLSHVPVAMSIFSIPTSRRPLTRLYEEIIDTWVWRSVAVVLVNAQAIADSLHDSRQMPREKVEVVHNGLEDARIHTLTTTKREHFVIGCIARMDVAKGVLILLDAFSVLAKSRPTLRLRLAGLGDASEELARRCKSLGLEDRVELLGHYGGDVNVLINTFDLYVFPSLWEGFPFSIVEAMRAGVPIVATRVGGVPEAVTDSQEGILVYPGSRDEIVEAVERVLGNSDLAAVMGRNARRKFEKMFTLDRMHERLRGACAKHNF